MVLTKYGVSHHVNLGNEPYHDDQDWVREDVTILIWFYATISEELLDIVMAPNSTAYGVWTHLEHLFRDNKRTRAIHLEVDIRSLVQGDLTITAYCHRLKALSDALADVDQPVSDETLVLQMIRHLNPSLPQSAPSYPCSSPSPPSSKRDHCCCWRKRHRTPPPAMLRLQSLSLPLPHSVLSRTR